MSKIVISGYYGFNNIGDESILTAVVDNLRDKIDNIEITVLSQSPQATAEKYNVKSEYRMDIKKVIKSIKSADVLISGGGSLLQDATSKKSIHYYLGIIWIALLLRKKVFIYSQGIGPIESKINRRIVRNTLNRVSNIVVRDEQSKELLVEIGIAENKIFVSADPVMRVKKADLDLGMNILKEEGYIPDSNKRTIGYALRGLKIKDDFIDEVCKSANELIDNHNMQIVFIPFHYKEDMSAIEKIKAKLGDKAIYIEKKYLIEEMLSLIGNMELIVGVRLHSLIHAAIMGVPMVAISYDPKINAFMSSLDMKALCSIYDFKSEFLIAEIERTLDNKKKIVEKIDRNSSILIDKLDKNEELIEKLLNIGE